MKMVFLAYLLAILCASPACAQVLVGAIRWDAWQDDSTVRSAVEKTLGPEHWHHRVPFFGEIVSPTQVKIDGNRQAVMDQEIEYAVGAGICYWAFVTYPTDSGMSNGLKLYLTSGRKSQINFCLNLQAGWIRREGNWSGQVERYVGHFKDASYQKVLNGRPLLYLFDIQNTIGPGADGMFADADSARKSIDQLRSASKAAGAGDPYIVLQGWSPADDMKLLQTLGADALGAYALSARKEDQPFADLITQAREFWNSQKAVGANVVPLLSTGWDNLPRLENPTPWDSGGRTYFRPATSAELVRHFTDGLAWVKENPEIAETRVILIYAWNEHDEGGWLCPTIGTRPNTMHLDALGDVVRQMQAEHKALAK